MLNKTLRIFPLLLLLFLSWHCQSPPTQPPAKSGEQPAPVLLPAENGIYSLLVSRDGKIVHAAYVEGKTEDSLCDVQSLTKGLMSILIGIAIDRGEIGSENDPVSQYLPEAFENLDDARKKQITIKQLLHQTSGLAWKGYLEHEAWLSSPDPLAYVLEKELLTAPGTAYNYNSGATHLLSAILTEASEKSSLAFAREYLFAPLNIGPVDWKQRNDGYFDGSGLDLRMRPVDLMKLGQLLENQGRLGEQVIVSSAWVAKLLDGQEKLGTKWGLRGSKHGYCWYQATLDGNLVNYGMGYGGQFILLVPGKNLVIVTTHNHDTPAGIEQQLRFLNQKLPGLIAEYDL